MRPNPYMMTHPVHMLDKAKLELERLKANMDAYTIFDFFVAAYHVMDYVQALGIVPEAAIKKMRDDPDFDMCNFICNKGKHLVLKFYKYKDKVLQAGFTGGAVPGLLRLGSAKLGSVPKWHFYCDGAEVKPLEIAESIIAKWDKFFKDNSII